MGVRSRIVLMLLLFGAGLTGCDGYPRQPAAPSPVQPQPLPDPRGVEGFTVTASPVSVKPEGELRVTWTAPTVGKLDWIGIFRVGARNCDYGWYDYTQGQPTGTFTIKAPSQPGQYEFRYHLDDGCVETARSAAVTVAGG